ncbi:MAG: hypothetical protein ABI686_14485 [Acidobacteriota bacterium]
MGITIKNATVIGDDGTFLRLVTNSNIDYPIDIDGLSIHGKRTTVFDISTPANRTFLSTFLESLEESDRKEYIYLLTQLQNKTKEEGMELVKKSTLLEKIGGVANIISITANLAALAANPSVQQLLTSLSN